MTKSELTFTLLVNIELCCRRRRLTNAVVCDTLDGVIVVPRRLDRLNAQHGSVWHVERRVALSAGRHATSALPPVDFRCRVARRFAEEADDAVVRYSLVTRCHRHLGRVCNTTTDHIRGCQSYVINTIQYNTKFVIVTRPSVYRKRIRSAAM